MLRYLKRLYSIPRFRSIYHNENLTPFHSALYGKTLYFGCITGLPLFFFLAQALRHLICLPLLQQGMNVAFIEPSVGINAENNLSLTSGIAVIPFKGRAWTLLFKSLKSRSLYSYGNCKERTMFWKTVRECFSRKLQHHCHYDPEVKVIKHLAQRDGTWILIIFMWIIIYQTNCSHDLIPPRKTGVYLQTNCLLCLFTVCFLIQQDGLWGNNQSCDSFG